MIDPILDKEHSQFVSKLCKPGDQIIADLHPESTHVLHMAIGFVGEIHELYKAELDQFDSEEDYLTNIKEELGDAYFYLQELTTVFRKKGIQFDKVDAEEALNSHQTIFFSEYSDPLTDLLVIGGEILDQAKKYAIYGKPMTTDMEMNFYQHINFAHVLFPYLVEEYDLQCSAEDIVKHNMDKLSKRYSSGSFSNKAAQDRADKQEGDK